jgi:hypothetical protein
LSDVHKLALVTIAAPSSFKSWLAKEETEKTGDHAELERLKMF